MPATKGNHPYANSAALDRLLVLIATLLHYPGVGHPDPTDTTAQATPHNALPHNALELVQQQMQTLAQQLGIPLKPCSTHTLRKDLVTLRHYGILDRRMYRWGYYLGTGVMTRSQLRVALNALYSQAKYQQEPQIDRIYQTLLRRLGDLQQSQDLLYPVRTMINQAIVYTNPEEMMQEGKYRQSLFEHLDTVEAAILHGQGLEIYRRQSAHNTSKTGYLQVYPLQVVYADSAWYLLCEECHTGLLAFKRIDRFDGHCKLLPDQQRSLSAQKASLEAAHKLRQQGWGLYLGQLAEQQLERQGQLEMVPVTVRFFKEVVPFIRGGERRHSSQEITPGPIAADGELEYVEYSVLLPPRSLKEFSFWVSKHLDNAEFVTPPDLANWHYQAAQRLVARYQAPPVNPTL